MVGSVRPSMCGMDPGFSWSAPEQKPRPAPVITTSRVELSDPSSRSASRKGIMTSNAMAFIRSGRLSVTTATPGCGLVTSVKDMVRHRRGATMSRPWVSLGGRGVPFGLVVGRRGRGAWCCGVSVLAIQRSRAALASQE